MDRDSALSDELWEITEGWIGARALQKATFSVSFGFL